MVDYYQNKDTKEWKPWSKLVGAVPPVAAATTAVGEYGTTKYTLTFEDGEGYCRRRRRRRCCCRPQAKTSPFLCRPGTH